MKALKIGVNFLKLGLMACGVLFVILTLQRSLVASSHQEMPDASQFRMEKIKKGSIENTISCTGTLSAVGTVEVGTQVSGTIEKVLVDYNDRVTKGQIIAELERVEKERELEKMTNFSLKILFWTVLLLLLAAVFFRYVAG